MNPFSKAYATFTTPHAFFKSIKKNDDWFTHLWSYALICGIATIIASVGQLLFQLILERGNPAEMLVTLISGIIGTACSLIFVAIAPFMSAGIIHLGVMLTRTANTRYIDTFKSYVYASCAVMPYQTLCTIFIFILIGYVGLTVEKTSSLNFLAFIQSIHPALIAVGLILFLIMIVSIIHTVVLQVIGLKTLHGITTWQAVFSIFVIPLVMLILMGIITLLLIGVIFLFMKSWTGAF